MNKRFILLATMMWTHVAIAAESKFIDDAPKGFIHVTGESSGAEVHYYLRANSLMLLRHFSEEEDGKLRHHIWLYNGVEIAVQLEFSDKAEADRVRVKILERMSAKD